MNQFRITWEIKTFEWKNFCISSIERHTVSGSDQNKHRLQISISHW